MSYQCGQRGCEGGWDYEELCLVTRCSCEGWSRVSREARVTRDRGMAGTGLWCQSLEWSSHTQSQCEGVCSTLHLVKLICDQEKCLIWLTLVFYCPPPLPVGGAPGTDQAPGQCDHEARREDAQHAAQQHCEPGHHGQWYGHHCESILTPPPPPAPPGLSWCSRTCPRASHSRRCSRYHRWRGSRSPCSTCRRRQCSQSSTQSPGWLKSSSVSILSSNNIHEACPWHILWKRRAICSNSSVLRI